MKNLIVLMFLCVIWICFCLVFFGCREFIIAIYDPMSWLKVDFISFPHLLAYMPYFIFAELVEFFLLNRIINLIIWFKDPASDDDARSLSHEFKFFYLMGIELVAPLFLMVVEPFSNTSCFSKKCVNEVLYYAYVRYMVILIELIIRSVNLCLIKSKATLKE